MVLCNLHHISATVMWSSGNKSITYLQTAHVWNHILQLLIWVYYWITVCKYLIWYSHMIVMWFVNMWFNVYHLSFAGGCLLYDLDWHLVTWLGPQACGGSSRGVMRGDCRWMPFYQHLQYLHWVKWDHETYYYVMRYAMWHSVKRLLILKVCHRLQDSLTWGH